MVRSNRQAACCVLRHGATACTDVTGFGLAGHLVEMLRASAVYAEIDLGAVPTLDGAEQTVARGILSSLQPQNVRLRRAIVVEPDVAEHHDSPCSSIRRHQVVCWPVSRRRPPACVGELHALGHRTSAIIGTITSQTDRPEMISVCGAERRVRFPPSVISGPSANTISGFCLRFLATSCIERITLVH